MTINFYKTDSSDPVPVTATREEFAYALARAIRADKAFYDLAVEIVAGEVYRRANDILARAAITDIHKPTAPTPKQESSPVPKREFKPDTRTPAYMRELLSTEIKYIHNPRPSVHLFNCLMSVGIRTLADLASTNTKGLRGIRNCGGKTINEARKLLESYDLHFDWDVAALGFEPWTPPTPTPYGF